MYLNNLGILHPPQPGDFPEGYQLTAWVQMQDFIFGETPPLFYGLVAQSVQNPNQTILAIRGTETRTEWWDNFDAAGMTGFLVGNVALGFDNIFNTMVLFECSPGGGASAPRSLKYVGDFSEQVAAHLNNLAAASPQAPVLNQSLLVTGHSLGAALATYYTAKEALVHKRRHALCTFASPRVGDYLFVDAFNALKLTSWRVVNQQDVVPTVPFGVPPSIMYQHVDTEQPYNSDGLVQPGWGCAHALATYLHLIDPAFPLDADCQLAQS